MADTQETHPGSEIREGMRVDWDVPIEMDDGVVLRADVFRPIEDRTFPVLLTYGPYAKGLAFQDGYPSAWERMARMHPDVTAGSSNLHQNWEVPDPEKWIPHGYVCVRVDSRGCGRSPGFISHFSPRETQDFHDCIEWAGVQPWSSGKVGLTGVSYYGINQWQVASTQPRHLAAMCIWEGASDWYRDMTRHGGILCTFWAHWYDMQIKTVQHGLGERGPRSRATGQLVCGDETLSEQELAANRSDFGAEIRAHVLDSRYHRERSPDWSKVTTPLLTAAIGILLATIGTDPIGGSQRLTFEVRDLRAGIGVIPLAIGLFGLSEVLMQLTGYRPRRKALHLGSALAPLSETFRVLGRYPRTILRSAVIGSAIGTLPGIGAETSNWIAYGMARRGARDPESFGKGNVEGVIAPEVSANAVCGAAMVPMLVFGIPGDIVTAIMMGALIAQGLNPGPRLLTENPEVFYSLFVSMFFAMIALAVIGTIAIRYAGRILNAPRPILFSIVTVLCFAGTYAVNASLFDVSLMVVFGVLGWFLRQIGVPIAPLILAFILSRLIEDSLRRTLILGDGSLAVLLDRPIALFFLGMTLVILVSLILSARKRRTSA